MTQAHFNALPILAPNAWQMSYGERAALEGIVAQLKPRLAMEIGTAEGGSLTRVAAHSIEVHSFDLVPPSSDIEKLKNVTFHTGDSHKLLPEVLDHFAREGRFVDFVLIDGDHSAEGVRKDIEDILTAQSVRSAIVLLHDTMNDTVRDGIERSGLAGHSKIAYLDLDFVPGYLARHDPYELQLWGGIGLVVVDADQRFNANGPVQQDRFHELFWIVRPMRDILAQIDDCRGSLARKTGVHLERMIRDEWRDREMAPGAKQGIPATALREQLDRNERILHDMRMSLSWRITEPLRVIKRLALSHRFTGQHEKNGP